MKYKIIQDSEKFFDLKNEAQKIYSEILDGNSIQKKIQSQFEAYLYEMTKIAKENKAFYYVERLRSIESKFIELKNSRFQNTTEAKRINKLLGKINETETAYFLNSVLNNKLEKIVRNNLDIYSNSILHNFVILRFQSSIIAVQSGKKKVIKDVDYIKKYISFNNKRIMIFPMFPISIGTPDDESRKSNILILQSGESYRCVRFDSVIAEEKFGDLELEERKIETLSKYEDLRYFLRWRGRNCFYLDFSETERDLPENQIP